MLKWNGNGYLGPRDRVSSNLIYPTKPQINHLTPTWAGCAFKKTLLKSKKKIAREIVSFTSVLKKIY